ncbi:hypothetical protein KR084_004558 [Drosophila pseudotakahashii]|nr:hypothetical protein KR084_004558 [Drosophila pseudotakahashii]
MNPFRPRPNANHHHQDQQQRVREMERRTAREAVGSVDESVERQQRLTPRPVIRLEHDHQLEPQRFLANLGNLLQRQTENLSRGAGDGVYVWRMRRTPVYTGRMGEGDNGRYAAFDRDLDPQEELEGPDPLA